MGLRRDVEDAVPYNIYSLLSILYYLFSPHGTTPNIQTVRGIHELNEHKQDDMSFYHILRQILTFPEI